MKNSVKNRKIVKELVQSMVEQGAIFLGSSSSTEWGDDTIITHTLYDNGYLVKVEFSAYALDNDQLDININKTKIQKFKV